jgi:Zn-dependent protease with chaperone function
LEPATADTFSKNLLTYHRYRIALEEGAEARFWLTFGNPRANIPPPDDEDEDGSDALYFLADRFGSRPSGPVRWALFAALLLLPVVLTLWARRRALRAGNADPTAAWFGFERCFGWLVLGTWLAWLSAESFLGADELLREAAARRGVRLSMGLCRGLQLLAPALVIVLCKALSHPVYARVRGAGWTRGDLVRQAVWGQASFLVPLTMALAGIDLLFDVYSGPIGKHAGLAVLMFGGALISWVVCRVLANRALGLTPQALTAGELRDRVFELARKAGVDVKQVYVLPAAKGRLANAFATSGNQVMLTDYVLERLSKREVDAVVAHELAHLRHRHLRSLRWTHLLLLVGMIGFTFGVSWLAGRVDLTRWAPVVFFVAPVLVITAVISFRQRRFEGAADAGAVELTGDPEALISGLVKLARLNLHPLQWGRWEGRLLSHPTTVKRVQAIAHQGGVTPERLQQLLEGPEEAGEHYTLPPELTAPDMVFSAAFKGNVQLRNALLFIVLLTLPPVLVARLAAAAPAGEVRWAVYLTGLPVLAAVLMLALSWLPVWGYGLLRRRLRTRLESEGLWPDGYEGTFVGFAPGPRPRVFEGFFDWDVGFLFLCGDSLCYVGERARFALGRGQITAVRPGPGGPGWWRTCRVYMTWRKEDGTEATFNLSPAGLRSLWHLGRESRAFAGRVREWWEQPFSLEPLPSPLAGLTAPAFGEVTGTKPGSTETFRSFLFTLAFLLPVGWGLSAWLGLKFDGSAGPGGWYALAATVMLLVLLQLPYWRYREPEDEETVEEAVPA